MTRAPWPRSDSAQPLPTSPYPKTTATLPPISTSVARLMPSISECRQPYLLSNFDFVTESLTLIAGNSRCPCSANWYSRCTPVVVSSVTPLTPAAMFVKRCGSSERERSRTRRITAISSESVSAGAGTAPARSYCSPLWTSRVASPPSSRIMFGPPPSGQRSTCSVHHQYSSSVSPFQAYTGAPRGSSGVPSGPTTTAAAAWSCVEKMLQLAQRTSAPSATSVSISTAVCTVMCSDPVMRAPVSGWDGPYSARIAIRPGISCSASVISLRPKPASARSATLKSVAAGVVVVVGGISPPRLAQAGLETVDRRHGGWIAAREHGHVDGDEVSQQNQRHQPREWAFPARLDALHGRPAVAQQVHGQLDPVAQAGVELGVLQEHGRERRRVAADLVVVGLRQLRGEGRRLGVLVYLALPAPRCGDRRAGTVQHRDGLAQR